MQTLRNFLIAFVVGLLLFGFAAINLPRHLGLGKYAGRDTGSDRRVQTQDIPVSDTTSQTETVERSENGYTMLIGGYDEAGELNMLLVASADRAGERFMLSSLPTALRVRVPDETGEPSLVRLAAMPWRFDGADCRAKIVETVEGITGLPIDYYIFFDKDAALGLFELTGGLYFDVPCEMNAADGETGDDADFSLSAGGQVLGKKRIIGLLDYDDYGLGGTADSVRRAETQVDFVDQALLQIMKLERSTLNRIAAMVLPTCDTNLTYEDYEFYAPLLERYADWHGSLARVIPEAHDPIEEEETIALFAPYRDE